MIPFVYSSGKCKLIHSDRKHNGDDEGIMTEGRIRKGRRKLWGMMAMFIILIGDDFKGVSEIIYTTVNYTLIIPQYSYI